MTRQQLSKSYTVILLLLVTGSLLASVVFYSGVVNQRLFELLSLALLLTYLHSHTAVIEKKMNYSFQTTAFFPIMFLFGPTTAMLMGISLGVVDGILNKKKLKQVILNISQLALSALAGSWVFVWVNGSIVPLNLQAFLGMIIGALAYIGVNVFIVSLVVAIATGRRFGYQLLGLSAGVLRGSLGASFLGILFTLFILAYDFFGLLCFSLLLIYLSELLSRSSEIYGARIKREELERELMTDEMTGAHNFRFLNEWLETPASEGVAVLFIDIDNFKEFNDRFGHLEGNRVLRTIVNTIQENIRSKDRVIRYGGDEFVVLMCCMNTKEADIVAKRIVKSLEEISLAIWQQSITVSIGVAIACSAHSMDKRQLLLQSDQAMYKAKNSGKNTIRIWQSQEGPV